MFYLNGSYNAKRIQFYSAVTLWTIWKHKQGFGLFYFRGFLSVLNLLLVFILVFIMFLSCYTYVCPWILFQSTKARVMPNSIHIAMEMHGDESTPCHPTKQSLYGFVCMACMDLFWTAITQKMQRIYVCVCVVLRLSVNEHRGRTSTELQCLLNKDRWLLYTCHTCAFWSLFTKSSHLCHHKFR